MAILIIWMCHSERSEESAPRVLFPKAVAGADPSPTPLRSGVRDDTHTWKLFTQASG